MITLGHGQGLPVRASKGVAEPRSPSGLHVTFHVTCGVSGCQSPSRIGQAGDGRAGGQGKRNRRKTRGLEAIGQRWLQLSKPDSVVLKRWVATFVKRGLRVR